MPVLAACAGGEKYVPVNALDAFVRSLGAEVTVDQLTGMFEEGVLDSGDSAITEKDDVYENYSPASAYNLPDAETAAQLVGHTMSETYYKQYSNNVILTASDYAHAPFNAAAWDDAKDTTKIDYANVEGSTDVAYIWDDGATSHYVMTRDDDAADPWSFKAERESTDGLFAELQTATAMSADLNAITSYVNESYAYYNGAWGSDAIISGEEYTITHDAGTLTVSYEGILDFNGYYSCALYWAETTDEYNILKYYYARTYYSFYYTYSIVDGAITGIDAGYFGVLRVLYEDLNKVALTADDEEAISDATLAQMNLVVPETITWPWTEKGAATIENPYIGDAYLALTAYECESIVASTKDFGKFDSSKLPNPDDYRDADSTDEGCYINVQYFLEWEPDAE